MIEAQKILEMIENVTHDGSAQLDEIDFRVQCYLGCEVFVSWNGHTLISETPWLEGGGQRVETSSAKHIKYTRSRDALKAIRPDSKRWWLDYVGYNTHEEGWDCMYDNGNTSTDCADSLPTEELAELHAIIQAIEWTRNNEM